MRVLQTISGMSAQSGGPSTCTLDLLNGLFEIGADVNLLTVSSDDILGKDASWLIEKPNDCFSPLGISRNLRTELDSSDYDLYHANALWSYSSHITCKKAREKNCPYIISPHGMLYPTALAIKRWKKRPMLKLWFNRDIQKASCLHATCMQEMEYCRLFGYKGPIAVIPNAVVFPDCIHFNSDCMNLKDEKGRRQIGFLGRLHPIKKVENVLYAIARLRDEGVSVNESLSFQIIGRFDDQYEDWLRRETERLELDDSVEFVGFVSGVEKYQRLSKLSALLVPSEQENFGMIVPEALICGTPVYASLGTPWSELNECNAGWWKDNSPETISEVIKDILSKTDAELLSMGRNGRALMLEKYEQHKVASMMKQLYEWIAVDKMNGDKKPEFVYV